MKKLSRKLLGILLFSLSLSCGAADLLDLNRADVEALSTLQKIGKVKAQRIVDYREANGPFEQIEDLAGVRGVGAKTVEINRDRIVVHPLEP